MKKKVVFITILLSLFVSSAFSQDVMTMKNGDEVKVKIIEISPDQIKYKKSDNLGGPTYTENKSNIFMIKYQNGSKDVFNQQSSNNPTVTNDADEKRNKAVEILHNYFINAFKSNGLLKIVSFKKINGVMRNVYGQSIYDIDFELKLQFTNNGYLKGNGAEGYWNKRFTVYPSQPELNSAEQYIYNFKFYSGGSIVLLTGTASMEGSDNGYQVKDYNLKTATDYGVAQPNAGTNKANNPGGNSSGNLGHYNFVYSNGDYQLVNSTVYYKSNSAAITSFSLGGINNDSEPGDIKVNGNARISTFLYLSGFKQDNGRYSFTYSVCSTLEEGEEFEKRENIESYNQNDPCIFEFDYNVPTLTNGASPKIFYMNFLIKDKNSDAVIQGYYKFTLVQ